MTSPIRKATEPSGQVLRLTSQAATGAEIGVNIRLTAKRQRPAVENHDYGIFARRVLRAYSRRVAAGDIEAIGDLTRLSTDIEKAIAEAITGLRSIGYSWADIALRLGITRQAAQQRWGGDQT